MPRTKQWVEEGRKDGRKDERMQRDRATDCGVTWNVLSMTGVLQRVMS